MFDEHGREIDEFQAKQNELIWRYSGTILEYTNEYYVHEALAATSRNFPIEIHDMYVDMSPPNAEELEIALAPNTHAIVAGKVNKLLGYVGSKYKPVQTASALAFADEIVDALAHAAWFAKLIATWDIDSKIIGVVIVMDHAMPLINYGQYIDCFTSHDGTKAIQAQYRFVNHTYGYLAPNLAQSNIDVAKVTHSGDYVVNEQFANIRSEAASVADEYARELNKLQHIAVSSQNAEGILDMVLQKCNVGDRARKRDIEYIMQLFMNPELSPINIKNQHYHETAYMLEVCTLVYYDKYRTYQSDASKFQNIMFGTVSRIRKTLREGFFNV